MATKTTIYLPEELKTAIEREARRRGCSEAELIRQAVTDAIHRPQPNPGLLDEEPFADRVDELLHGFGQQ